MTAIRHSLQRQLFDTEDEKIFAVTNVKKSSKKKNSSFLGLTVTNTQPVTVKIVQIKESDKDSYKVKRRWPLTDLKKVDGRTPSEDSHEMDLHLDKVFKWITSNAHERQTFVKLLWKYCCSYLPKQKPDFLNFPPTWLDQVKSPTNDVRLPSLASEESIDEGIYQAISEQEAQALEHLMTSCQSAVANADNFMDGLAKELAALDGENVHSVLSSEDKVEDLMRKVEQAIGEAERLDSRLASYDSIICHIRDAMEEMETKNMRIAVAAKNNHSLLNELDYIISQLDLSPEHQQTLVNADLTTVAGLREAVAAGSALISAMNADIHPALVRMQAVQDQRKRFDKLKAKFSITISTHLNNQFVFFVSEVGEGNDAGETLNLHAKDLTLPSHQSIRSDIEHYTPLMHWLKLMDRKAFVALSQEYVRSLGKLYSRDVRAFFDEAKVRVMAGRERRGRGLESREDLAGKLKQQAQSLGGGGAQKGGQPIANLLGLERDQWSQDVDDEERMIFDEVFEQALTQLEPVCLSEQNFCVSFFKLDVLSPTTKNTQTTLDASIDVAAESEVTPNVPQSRIEKKINEDVRKMMAELFSCLEGELNNFIAHFEKIDGYFLMSMLVRLNQHVMSTQDTGSFLAMSLGSALVRVKRSFDTLMEMHLRSIRDYRPNKKNKCGVITFVANWKEFVLTAEGIFKQTSRRDALDKAYVRLMGAIFDAIPRIGAEHSKTPAEVVKMENFHYLHGLLSQLKIATLDNYRKDAKQRYNDALRNYVTQYFGRPLEKLNQFFDGVEAKVAQGVKESEVSYQMAFSKEQLRKVIALYPAREVKKGLEHLYRKVEKHLSEDVNLLQVVWRAMQEEFIQQYKNLEELMQRCYPGSMMALEFSIADILNFFSEIARSH